MAQGFRFLEDELHVVGQGIELLLEVFHDLVHCFLSAAFLLRPGLVSEGPLYGIDLSDCVRVIHLSVELRIRILGQDHQTEELGEREEPPLEKDSLVNVCVIFKGVHAHLLAHVNIQPFKLACVEVLVEVVSVLLDATLLVQDLTSKESEHIEDVLSEVWAFL